VFIPSLYLFHKFLFVSMPLLLQTNVLLSTEQKELVGPNERAWNREVGIQSRRFCSPPPQCNARTQGLLHNLAC
jgi:hypothetical protein